MEEKFRIEQINCGYLVSPGKVTFDMDASAKLSVVKHLINTLWKGGFDRAIKM